MDKVAQFFSWMKQNKLKAFFSVIGIYVVFRQIWKLHKYVGYHFISRFPNLKKFFPGDWAIIAGAEEIVGQHYARLLASKGFKLILIGFSEAHLQELCLQIKSKYDNEVLYYHLQCKSDFSSEDVLPILEVINSKDIGIVINNFSYEASFEFHTVEATQIKNFINRNINFHLHLLKIFLPLLRIQSHKSAIITISSLFSNGVFPYFHVYGATQAFLISLIRSLSIEYTTEGIDFLCVRRDSFLNIENPFSISPEVAAHAYLSKLGKKVITNGHWKHDFEEICWQFQWNEKSIQIMSSILLQYSKTNQLLNLN